MAKQVEVAPGTYTVSQLLEAFGFDLEKEATVQHGDGDPYVDHRRVEIGRLGFTSVDDVVVVPEGAEELELAVDGKVVSTAKVTSK